MTNQSKSYLFAGTAIFFWSTVATAFKIALHSLHFVELVFYATLVSFLVYLVILFIQGKHRLLKGLQPRDWLSASIMGFLNPCVYYLILFKAYSLLPAQVAQPLNMVWPILLVFLAAPLLKHRIARKSYVALVMGFAGVLLISSQGQPGSFGRSDPLGVSLALGSAVLWSLYWIFNVKDKKNEEVKLFLNFGFALAYIFLITLLTGNFRPIAWKSLLPAVYVGLFEMGITFLLWLKALQLTKTSDRISTLVYLAPFLSLVFIRSILNEHIHLTTVIGLIVIVAGILFQKITFNRIKNIK